MLNVHSFVEANFKADNARPVENNVAPKRPIEGASHDVLGHMNVGRTDI